MENIKFLFPIAFPLTCRVELLGAFIALTCTWPVSPLYKLFNCKHSKKWLKKHKQRMHEQSSTHLHVARLEYWTIGWIFRQLLLWGWPGLVHRVGGGRGLEKLSGQLKFIGGNSHIQNIEKNNYKYFVYRDFVILLSIQMFVFLNH